MNIICDSDREHIKGICIMPEANEDEKHLNSLAQKLMVRNPGIDFGNAVKQGLYNHLSDKEYDRLLAEYKAIGALFIDEADRFGKQFPAVNIFLLTERLLYAYLRTIDVFIKDDINIKTTV